MIEKKLYLILILVWFTMMTSHCEIHNHGDGHHDNHEYDDTHKCTNKYNEQCNKASAKDEGSEETEMFKRGHLKPFGSHRSPDALVEELHYSISPQDFYMNYVIKHKPVVLKGSVKHWPAYTKWTDEYLYKTYGDVKFLMETKDDNKKNLPPAMNLSIFLDTYRDINRYLVDEVLPDMRKDVVLPLELRCEEMTSYFFVSYFWMSNGGTSSKIHIDTDENLLCVIHGHKSVIIVSPEYSADLYTDEGFMLGVSDINPQSVDMNKYPRVKNVRYLLANVEEGDIVYIPQMWWHQVVSRKERQQAVAMWWKSKPFWLEEGKTSFPKPSDADQKNKDSYAKALADYERWINNVSAQVPRIKCTSQDSLMSDYKWETDKIPDAPITFGDGGNDEEEKVLTEGYHKGVVNARDLYEREPCNYDRSNPHSPCHYDVCIKEDENPKCIRYMLDYCAAYHDRGCVIQLPQLLNKRRQDEYQTIRREHSDFKN